jgi:hypothetical protein
MVSFLKHKSEVLSDFRLFRTKVEKMFDRSIKTLRSDGGGEYTSKEFSDYLQQAGISHDAFLP